ncbi:unnamed protein product [Spirodela intermedia]|uniref:Uncharacterized protein n=1 Tax=Spirodela intermedia TaxID=51605 RepID=A0A7I8KG92_SPIIN|nr:unnamed protein product [Spirodela intermedia]
MTAQVSTGALVVLVLYATELFSVLNRFRTKKIPAHSVQPLSGRGRMIFSALLESTSADHCRRRGGPAVHRDSRGGHGRSAVITPLQQTSWRTWAPPQCCRRCHGLRRSPCGEARSNEDRCCYTDRVNIHGRFVSPHPSLLGGRTNLSFPGIQDQ